MAWRIDKSTALKALFLWLLFLPGTTVWAATYQARSVPFSWDDPTSHTPVQWTGTGSLPDECNGVSAPPDDAISQELPLGFAFRFAGTDYTSVRIMSNGRVQFGNAYCGYGTQSVGPPRTYPFPYPDSNLNRTLRILGADLDPSAGGQVTWATLGSAPNRRFVVTWSNVPEWSWSGGTGSLNLQLVVYENGSFEYRYGNQNYTTGGLPQIGWQIDNTDYALYGYANVAALQNSAILWEVPQPVAYWSMDEASWNGSPGEVVDGTGNGHDGQARGNARPLPARVCNGADLNGLGASLTDYIEVPDSNGLDMPSEVSVSIWVYPRRYPPGGLMTILSKDTNYEFHLDSSGRVFWWWRDSNGTVRSFTSSAAVPLNQWTHIAITYRSGEQVIYLNGNPSATRTWTGGLSTNNLPLFLGDDRIPNRRWVGKLDEARLFDTALSPEQVRWWMEATHPCPPTPISGCGDVYPMALQNSAPGGKIKLEDATQVLGSPGNQLGTTNLQDSSTLPSCGATNCSASGTTTPPALVPPFKTTGTNYDVTVPNGGSFALGSDGRNEYDRVRIGNNATLTDSGNYGEYLIDRLELRNGSRWVLRGGVDYWVRDLRLGNNVEITVAPGTGTARLFVQRNVTFDNGAALNPGGDPAAVMLVAYGDAKFKDGRSNSALVVGLRKVKVESNAQLVGAISAAGEIKLEDGTVVYDPTAVASVDHRGLCRGTTGPTVASYQITHDGHGINCLDEPITVRALDAGGNPVAADGLSITLDSGTGRGSWQLQSGTGTLTDATADDGLATYAWGSGETTATFLLSYRQGPRTVTVSANDGTASGTAAPLPFDPSGFVLSSQPLGNPPPNPTPAFAAQTAGTTFPVYLTAYGITATDPVCGVIEAYDGAKTISFWTEARDPAAQILQLALNGSAVGTSAAGATPLAVTFSQGQAQVSAKYKDVGRIALFARDPSVTDPNLPTGYLEGNAEFVSRPADLKLSNIVATARNTPTDCQNGTTPNPAATGPGGGLFAAAGQPFCVTVTAQDAEGDATPSFGREATPESVHLAATISPDCGAPCISNPGLVVEEDFTVGGFSNGAATGRFSWAEVGIIDLQPSIADGDYLGTGDVMGTASGNVGRFAPWDFGVTLNNAPSLQPASSGFSYLGQSFGWNQAPSVTITARSRGGTVTRNYDGAWWKLPDIVPAYNANPALPANTTLDASAATVNGFACPTSDACDGQATLLFGGQFTVDRQVAEIEPFDLNLDIRFPVSDGDASYASNPFVISAIAFDDGDPATTTDSQMRSGRAVLTGAYGQPNQALRLYFWTQYYTADGFVNNDVDTATSYTASASNPACSVLRGPLACADVTVSGTAGHGQWFDLSAPGVSGALRYTLAVDPWLQFDWDGDGVVDNDPQADVVFGIFRGDDRVIHWRERR